MKIKPIECTYGGYPTKYCSKCGSLLTYKFEFHHYDEWDAEKVFTGKAVCPNRKYFWDGHTNKPMEGYGGRIMFYEREIPKKELVNE